MKKIISNLIILILLIVVSMNVTLSTIGIETNRFNNLISKKIYSKTIECVGSETVSMKEILRKLLKLMDKNRLLIPFPLFIAKMSAILFQLFPKPLLTVDQLILLKYDNILSNKYQSNFDVGAPSTKMFDQEVEKYCYMWKEGGQFSTKKYNSTNS